MAVYTIPIGFDRLNVSRSGATFTANSSGFIIRKKRKPLLKRTEKSSQSRVNFRNVVSNYHLLSSGEKFDWASKTPQFTRVNSLGSIYELLGNQLFQGLNQNRVNQGEVINEIAPDATIFPVRSIISDGFDIDPVDIDVNLNIDIVPVDFNFHFWASEVSNSNPSLSFPQDYKLIRSFAPGAYGTFLFTFDYRDSWGPGPTIQIGFSRNWYLQIVLEALYLPSGEKSVLDSHVASIFQ
ncbi:hypothetical protein KAR91_14675 [Candidatus Pacearchaeota archaeon]|nr:hypothetical protein [Candidatus Pacearchaeota archaeon]